MLIFFKSQKLGLNQKEEGKQEENTNVNAKLQHCIERLGNKQ